ncbi:MAG: DNA-3-methyladenine glycosylase [Oscillospiraceae bacterium]
MEKLTRAFYDRDTITVARDLLGKHLVRVLDGETLVCRITETEAYIGRCDKACHAYGYKRTNRTETLFARPGTAYIYLIYGMYNCLNFVTEPEGEPAAVLIRGLEAVSGIETMTRLRYPKNPGKLTAYQQKYFLNGPGKLCKALSLDRSLNGLDLTGDTLYVVLSGETPETIHCGPRIGIDYAEEAVDFPWRFWI